jgi:hypothetical protein
MPSFASVDVTATRPALRTHDLARKRRHFDIVGKFENVD